MQGAGGTDGGTAMRPGSRRQAPLPRPQCPAAALPLPNPRILSGGRWTWHFESVGNDGIGSWWVCISLRSGVWGGGAGKLKKATLEIGRAHV